jgi:hypothetical protein
MLQISFDWAAPMLLEVLPKSGMTVNGRLYELQILAPLIKGGGGSALHGIPEQSKTRDGLLPTPTATGTDHRHQYSQGGRPLLYMMLKGLPTPRAYGGNHIEDPQKRAKRKEKHGSIPDSLGNSILEMVQNGQIQLPTPNAADSKNTPLSQSRQSGKHQKCLNTVMGKMVLDGQIMGITVDQNIGKQLRIHPHFVEWMMGFPIGWLD